MEWGRHAAQGARRIPLSVDPQNPARRHYLRPGYVDLQPDDEDGRTILDLT